MPVHFLIASLSLPGWVSLDNDLNCVRSVSQFALGWDTYQVDTPGQRIPAIRYTLSQQSRGAWIGAASRANIVRVAERLF